METEIAPIRKAGLIPTASHIAMFDELLREYGSQKQTSLHETLRKFSEMATVQGKPPITENYTSISCGVYHSTCRCIVR